MKKYQLIFFPGKSKKRDDSLKYYSEQRKLKKKAANKNYYERSKSEKEIKNPLSILKEATRKRAQRQKLKEIKKAAETKKNRNREYMKIYRQKKKMNTCSNDQLNCGFRNRMQRSRAIKALKHSLPATPRRRASVLSSYFKRNSPTVEKLQRTGVIYSRQERSRKNVETSVLSDLKTALHKTKKKRSTENLQSRNIIFAAITGESVKKSKCKRQLANCLGVHRRQIAGGIRTRCSILKDDVSSWKLTEKKNRANKISDEIKRKVYNFWLSPGISRPTGNKKDVKRERLAPHTFVSHSVSV